MHGRTGILGALALLVTAVTLHAAPPAGEVLTAGKWSTTLPLGLQAGAANIPDDNPMSDDKIALGKFLYFDKRMSSDNTIACASCHNPFHGFADPARTSTGVGFKPGGRNSPTVINRLFSADQFWDGRAASLEAQAAGPMTNPVEMAMASHDVACERIKGVKGYAPLFKKVYGDETVDIGRITKAIAAYERTVLSGDSPFDRYQAGAKDALSADAVRGLELFNGKANCRTCHTGFNFADEGYHNIGVGMKAASPDAGRMDQTKAPADRGKFKTPTLRNVSETAPYMHDGSEDTLEGVIEFYDRGGVPNPNLAGEIQPLQLTAAEKSALVAFLRALTGPVRNAVPPTPETMPR